MRIQGEVHIPSDCETELFEHIYKFTASMVLPLHIHVNALCGLYYRSHTLVMYLAPSITSEVYMAQQPGVNI